MSGLQRPFLRLRHTHAAAIALAVTFAAAGAFAADMPASLSARLDADQAQMRRLEAKIARAQGVQVAQIFGESDEEKAARQAHEDNQDATAARLGQRITDMEDSLRRLTGQVEDLSHRMELLNDRITKMQKDFDYKICTITAQQLGVSTDPTDPDALPCSGQGQAQTTIGPVISSSSGDTAPIHLRPPSGVLGTLPANPGPAVMNGAPAPSGDTRKKFDAAMNLLARAQYDEASGAFRSFADTYPDDDLAPQAVYWVGDIAYVQKDYANAARAFAEEIKKYPTSPRSPDSMLKLGQSLIAMDQKKEGCTTLAALPGKYPQASKAVTDQAKAARKEAACR